MTEIQNIRKVALLALLLCFMAVVGRAQDKKDMFNPVNASVTSQTIAPDARGAGMGDAGHAQKGALAHSAGNSNGNDILHNDENGHKTNHYQKGFSALFQNLKV